jgi:hypothetical protein
MGLNQNEKFSLEHKPECCINPPRSEEEMAMEKEKSLKAMYSATEIWQLIKIKIALYSYPLHPVWRLILS